MIEKYKPSRREVLEQMTRDVYPILERTMKRTGKFSIDFLKGLGMGVGSMILGTHVIPTVHRYVEQGKNELNLGEGIGLYLGCLPSCAGLAALMVTYIHISLKGHPEILTIPIATNLTSLTYEWYRNARNRCLNKHKEQNKER